MRSAIAARISFFTPPPTCTRRAQSHSPRAAGRQLGRVWPVDLHLDGGLTFAVIATFTEERCSDWYSCSLIRRSSRAGASHAR
jgi:hypothetical protein